jgi:hypothetical protein
MNTVPRGLRSSHVAIRHLDNIGTSRGADASWDETLDSADDAYYDKNSGSGGVATLIVLAVILLLLAVVTVAWFGPGNKRPENDASDGNTIGSLEDEDDLDDVEDGEVVKS